MASGSVDVGGGPERGPAPPEYWSAASDAAGTTLTYAVRGGGKQKALAALGGALALGGAWALWRFLTEGELAGPGVVLLLVPAGAVLAGVHCLDIALRAKTTYVLGSRSLAARRSALFGGKTLEVPRQAVTGVSQRYSPPGRSAPSGAAGDWVTAVSYREGGAAKEIVFDGLTTREEARWLGPLLERWAGAPAQRGFAGGFEEADPATLPEL